MKTLLRTVTLLALFFLINQASAQTYFFSVESAEYEPILKNHTGLIAQE